MFPPSSPLAASDRRKIANGGRMGAATDRDLEAVQLGRPMTVAPVRPAVGPDDFEAGITRAEAEMAVEFRQGPEDLPKAQPAFAVAVPTGPLLDGGGDRLVMLGQVRIIPATSQAGEDTTAYIYHAEERHPALRLVANQGGVRGLGVFEGVAGHLVKRRHQPVRNCRIETSGLGRP